MTLDEIKNSKQMFIRPIDVAGALHISPQAIRIQAKNGTLPYKSVQSGNRTYILRQSFLDYVGG